MTEAESCREEFEGRIAAMDALTVDEDPDARKQNTLSDELRARIGEWDEQGITAEILRPLLDSENPSLRGSAAGFMLRRGEQERALGILHELADNVRLGDVSSMAETALLAWKQEQKDQARE